MELAKLVPVVAGPVERRLEIVEKQRTDDLHDVAFAGVVGADLPSLAGLHDRLEQGPEYGR